MPHNDEERLRELFSLVTPQDLRFRFFGGIGKVSHERLVAMTRFDHRSTENYLVFAGDTNILIASAMMACDASWLKAEVAIAVNAQYKNRGRCIGVASYVADEARAKGVRTLQSIERREHHDAVRLEQEQGLWPNLLKEMQRWF